MNLWIVFNGEESSCEVKESMCEFQGIVPLVSLETSEFGGDVHIIARAIVPSVQYTHDGRRFVGDAGNIETCSKNVVTTL